MSGESSPPELLQAEQIDAACDRFEKAWLGGHSPRLEDFLAEMSASAAPELLRALLAVELELRLGRKERLTSKEYEQRFPEFREIIRRVFQEFQASGPGGAPEGRGQKSTISLAGPAVDTSLTQMAGREKPRSDSSLLQSIGRFEILGVLGAGAFGTVYKARDPKLDRMVAIKVPNEGVLKTDDDRQRFLREARAAANLAHPKICPVHEVGEQEGRDYIVMGFVDGKPLSELVPTGRITPRQAAMCVRKLALAFEEAHERGIVHRDIKPSNVMISRKGEPIVMDFGLARLHRPGDAQITHSGQIMGSPAYMSPEQARGASEEIGAASDIYSLGVVLFELLCGRRPFTGTVTEVLGMILHVPAPTPSSLKSGIDPALEAICLKAMAKSPAERYASMREFAAAIARYLRDPGNMATTLGTASETVETKESEPRLESMLVALVEQQRSATHNAVQEAVREGVRSAKPPWTVISLIAALAAMLTFAGIWFFIRKDTVTVVVQIPIDTSDPSLSFLLDGKGVAGDVLASPIELEPGEHELIVNRDGKLFRRFLFNVGKADNQPVVVQDMTPKGPARAIAPFSDVEAKAHQEAWASYLGVPVEFRNSIGMTFRLIPPGTYRRGLSTQEIETLQSLGPTLPPGSLSGESPSHTVEITRPFWLGVHEVTVGQFRQFVEADSFVTRAEIVASREAGRRTWKSVPWKQTEDHPVVNVSWAESQAFVQWLSRYDGWDYRFPTEGEWELACRAGTEGVWWTGNDVAALAKIANVGDKSAAPRWQSQSSSKFFSVDDRHPEAAPVGSFAPNPFGLHDLIGNVWEWCSDRHDENEYKRFAATPATDPVGAPQVDPRVRRGGSWLNGNPYCTATSRQSSFPDSYGTAYGFRVAMTFDPKQSRTLTADRMVARKVLELGGTYRTTDGQQVQGDPRLVRSTPFHIQKIMLDRRDQPDTKPIHDGDLKLFSSLTSLTTLHVGSTGVHIQGAGLAYLKSLGRLEELHVMDCPLTDEGLTHLAHIASLRTLRLDGTRVTDAGLEALKSTTGLRAISLDRTGVTRQGRNQLRVALPECRVYPEDPKDAPGDKFVTNSIGMKLIPIPAGEFVMGSPESEPRRWPNEGPVRQVSITEPFHFGMYEVTQAEYEAIMGINPSPHVGPNLPVGHVRWDEAKEFCRKLSELPAERAANRAYRLPYEKEWEYACRAGTTTVYHFGDSMSLEQANFNGYDGWGNDAVKLTGNAPGRPVAVGSYPPNAWGLYDMHGNVPESCEELWEEQNNRVIRGGGWNKDAGRCRAAYRGGDFRIAYTPRIDLVGLRVVMVPHTGALPDVDRSVAEWATLEGVGGTATLVFSGTNQVVHAGEPLPTRAFSIMALTLNEGDRAGDSVLGRLSRLSEIRQLDLSGQPVTDAGLKHLQPLKSLRTLNLQNTGVTASGVEALRRELPACQILH